MHRRVGSAAAVRLMLAAVMRKICVAHCAAGHGADAQTLKAVKERGHLVCGVSQGIAGFSAPQPNGDWAGFDVDFCRALAAAIFDDPRKVAFVPLSASERFTALAAGKIDVLSRNSTWTMEREAELGVVFAGVTYYDGQSFMVRRARNVGAALDLGGSKVCVQSGTTTELNLVDYFSAGGMKYEAVRAATVDDAVKAYDAGACDVFTSDASQLYAVQLPSSRQPCRPRDPARHHLQGAAPARRSAATT